MDDPKQRLVPSVSSGELERRWKAAREMMRDRKIDFVLMRQDEEYYGGYVRWFSAVAPRHGYPFTVIFPRDDEMTTIASAPPGQGKPPKWAVYGVKETLGAPYYPSFHFTNTLPNLNLIEKHLIETQIHRAYTHRRIQPNRNLCSQTEIPLPGIFKGDHSANRLHE